MNMVAGMPTTQNLGPQATEPSSTSGQSEAHHGPGGQKMQNVSKSQIQYNEGSFLMKLPDSINFFPFSITHPWLTVCPPPSGGAPAAAPQPRTATPPNPLPNLC